MPSSTSSSDRPAAGLSGLRERLAGALAVLGPLAVVLACLALLRSDSATKAREVIRMEEELASREPEVVVIGNSLVRTGIAPGILAAHLGLPKDKVYKLVVEGSKGPTWFLVLKNRIFAQGHRPRLIVIANTLNNLLASRIVTEESWLDILRHREREEPVMAAKVHGFEEQELRVRVAVRERWLSDLRDLSLGLIFGPGSGDGGDLLRAGDLVAHQALSRIFGFDRVDQELYRRVIPSAQRQEREQVISPFRQHKARTSPEKSLMPDIVEIARSHGASVAFVLMPVTAGMKSYEGMGPATQQAARKLALELGAEWLDLQEIELPPDCFSDPIHLNDRGAVFFTREMGRALAELGDHPGKSSTSSPIPR